MTIHDFEIVVDGKRRPTDTLDLACEEGAADEATEGGDGLRSHGLTERAGRDHVGVDELNLLQVISTNNLAEILRAILDVPAWIEIVGEKKNTPGGG